MNEKLSWLDRIMAAITFAEANESDVGKDFLTGTVSKTEKKHKCAECDDLLTADLHGAEVHS